MPCSSWRPNKKLGIFICWLMCGRGLAEFYDYFNFYFALNECSRECDDQKLTGIYCEFGHGESMSWL